MPHDDEETMDMVGTKREWTWNPYGRKYPPTRMGEFGAIILQPAGGASIPARSRGFSGLGGVLDYFKSDYGKIALIGIGIAALVFAHKQKWIDLEL